MNGAGFTVRLVLVQLVVLLAYGGFAAGVWWRAAQDREAEVLQRVSHALAAQIVARWPQLAAADRGTAERSARAAVLAMLEVANPGAQAYLLDADGRVAEYLGEPGMVREHQVDPGPLAAFLADGRLPIRGTDPMGSGQGRLFSVARFPPRAHHAARPGYLYVVLDGGARQQAALAADARSAWRSAFLLAASGLVLAVLLGAFSLLRLTRPLQRLALRMGAYSQPLGAMQAAGPSRTPGHGTMRARDEVQVLELAFEQMTARIEAQAGREREQARAHREILAGVAHDLRTPLTALHGQLEALARSEGAAPPPAADAGWRAQVLRAALAQSDKVRQLTQQLFELAALQSASEIAQRERFRLDELVADAVAKFHRGPGAPAVLLDGESPGRIEVEGDLRLVERALSNLIDNALRHAASAAAVRVSVRAGDGLAQVVVQDGGPGLPTDLHRRLTEGQGLRVSPIRQARGGVGGIGGLGLAIAQRVAVLHGGRLLPLPAPQGGTRLCLALPLAG